MKRRKKIEYVKSTPLRDPRLYHRMVRYNSYVQELFEQVEPQLKKNFGCVLVHRNSSPTCILHPRVHVLRNYDVTFYQALQLLSKIQRAVHEVASKGRPPGRIKAVYPHLMYDTQVNGLGLEIILPHRMYGVKRRWAGYEIVLPAAKNLSFRLMYSNDRERKYIGVLKKAYLEFPEVPHNSVQESLGAYYVLKHHKGGKSPWTYVLRSPGFFNSGRQVTEVDLMLLEGRNIEIYEMKTSDRMTNPVRIFEEKLRKQEDVVRFLSRLAPVEYHFVITGHDPTELRNAVNAAKQVLQRRITNLSVAGAGVHGVLVDKKGVTPFHVERIL